MAKKEEITKENNFNKKQEFCWLAFFIVMGAISESNIIDGIIIGIIQYLFCFLVYHKIIKKIINKVKYNFEQDKLQQEKFINICNMSDVINEYFTKKDYNTINSQMNVSKKLELSNCTDFMIDTINKKFLFYTPRIIITGLEEEVAKMLENGTVTMSEITNALSTNSVPTQFEGLYKFSLKLYNFKDLNKIEFIDKTKTNETRTYTMEDKSGDALWGAVAGSMLSETIFDEYATAGAIIGASGERKITENVERDTHVEFCINLYLNDIDEPYKSFTLSYEDEVRQFVGILEYIKNNK